MPGLRFVTWNWNVFTSYRDADKLALLDRLSADVVALQEISRGSAERLRDHLMGWTIIDGVSRSGWEGARANGAALAIRQGIPVVDVEPLRLEGWESISGPADAVPPAGSVVRAAIEWGRGTLEVMSAHPPNAAGRRHPRDWEVARKLRTYVALESWIEGRDPLVLGMDTNAWIDSTCSPFEPPVFNEDDPQVSIMHFFLDESGAHGLRDAYRAWLTDHDAELVEIRRRRPQGPLATTYVRGVNYPVPDRFDVVMVSPSIHVDAIEHGYEDALAAGSDHAYVAAELSIEPG